MAVIHSFSCVSAFHAAGSKSEEAWPELNRHVRRGDQLPISQRHTMISRRQSNPPWAFICARFKSLHRIALRTFIQYVAPAFRLHPLGPQCHVLAILSALAPGQ